MAIAKLSNIRLYHFKSGDHFIESQFLEFISPKKLNSDHRVAFRTNGNRVDCWPTPHQN